jgi:hypothetical protein
MQIDKAGWSGEGDFTIELVEVLEAFDEIALIKVEDAPASRAGSGFNLLANEIFLTFATLRQTVSARWLGLIPVTRHRDEPKLTLATLEDRLAALEAIGAADYSDEGMLQYLRTQHIIAPYQTRGYKLVELVRIYEVRPNAALPTRRHGMA